MPETVAGSASAASAADFELGRSALLDMTPAETIGDPAGSIDEGDGVITVYFDNTMPGYKGWRWTVSIAHIDGGEPSVLETELTPGESALLSPAWVPWADRLADYKAGQAEQAAGELDAEGTDGDDDDDDDDDDDFDDDDDDESDDDEALLHSGDLDGVDIDSLDDEDDDEDEDEDDESDDFDESAPTAGVDEPDESEDESGDAGPNPPAVGRRNQRAKK